MFRVSRLFKAKLDLGSSINTSFSLGAEPGPIMLTLRRSSTTTPPTSPPFSSNQKRLTFWQTFGTPITNFFLWSSSTYVALHFLWYKLDYKEYVEQKESELLRLEQETS
ncbi:hypothetical protein G9A89_023966 [Geosiphon pyriformis]|nr:hypothetical protein G9A89_023966 [Geosiphon pyriformis]